MEYKKIENKNYNLHLIKTDKFKRTMIRINFKNKVTKEDIVKRKLISEVLLESNSIYSTKRLLAIKTEDLYNLAIYNRGTMSGNALICSFEVCFLNDKYSEEGLLNEAINFLCDVIFRPKVEDEQFDLKALELAKKRMKEDIDSIKESPYLYLTEQAYKIIGKNTSLEISPFGTYELIDSIDSHELYTSYLSYLKNDNVDIFVIGNIDFKETEKIFKEQFDINNRKKKEINHYIEFKKVKNRFSIKKEQIDNNQSLLFLGYKLKDLTNYEKQYVLPIYSYILGGGPDSKLFKNVREKHSLCYSVNSQIKPVSNVMYITAGINAKNYKKALNLIKEEVDNMKNGNFDDSDMMKAKLTYITAYKEIKDSMSSILNTYANHEYLDSDLLDEKEKNIMKVTKEDILKVIPKIYPDLVYFLEGTKKDEEDATC